MALFVSRGPQTLLWRYGAESSYSVRVVDGIATALDDVRSRVVGLLTRRWTIVMRYSRKVVFRNGRAMLSLLEFGSNPFGRRAKGRDRS